MTPEDFRFLAAFLHDRSGLVLGEDKGYLVESRLSPVARRHGLATLDELVARLRAGRDTGLADETVEAMTTNESFFFRDIGPFESLAGAVLPELAARRRAAGARRIRIWSAACSSGQEPYSIAMVLAENPALTAGLSVEIVGTDLSTEMLAKAGQGSYTQFEVQRGLPVQLLVKYFEKAGEHWRIDAALRARVRFEHANLLDDLGRLGRFDIVFCRNVLIYFDAATRAGVLGRIRAMMPDDGYLFLGGAETVLGVTDAFAPLADARGVYRASGVGVSEVEGKAVQVARSA